MRCGGTYASCHGSINSVEPDASATGEEVSATGAETARVASIEVAMMLKICILNDCRVEKLKLLVLFGYVLSESAEVMQMKTTLRDKSRCIYNKIERKVFTS